MKGLYRNLGVVGCSFMLFALSHAQTPPNSGSLGGTPILTGEEGNPPDWGVECSDPTNKTPYSAGYATDFVANQLMMCTMGGGGTWTAGGSENGSGTFGTGLAPCFSPPGGSKSINNEGQFCFSYGYYAGSPINQTQATPPLGVGSLQQYSPGFRDANLALDFGAPTSPGYCYAAFIDDGNQVRFGQKWTLFFAGESNRYMTFLDTSSVASFSVDLQVELVADAARFRWTCTNTTSAPHTLQLWFCSGVNMLDDQNSKYWQSGNYAVGNFGQAFFPSTSGTLFGYGPDAAGGFGDVGWNESPNGPTLQGGDGNARLFRESIGASLDPNGYQGIFIYLPNQRPPTTDEALIQASDPVTFPDYVDFDFGETDAFGFRIETKPSTSTNDTNPTNIPNKANELVFGKDDFIIGDVGGTETMEPTNLIPDTGFLDVPAFIVMYDPETIPGGTTFQFLNYIRSTWGNASYSLPFGAVVDAPAVIQEGPTNFDGTASGSFTRTGPLGGGIVSNATADAAGFPDCQLIRVWIDNVGGNVTSGYGVKGKEFTLDDVQVNLSFGAPGMTIKNVGGATQTIASIAPRTSAFVDFYVQLAQNVVGDIPYTVTIDTVPQNHKVITGSIEVSGRPQFNLQPGANFVTAPYVFGDSSWESILEDFISPATPGVGAGATANTYQWDADRQGYVQSLSAARGNGYWVIFNNPTNKPVFAPMEGQPTVPYGFDNSTQQIELKPGWNMIASPYDLEFPITQMNGVSASNPDTVFTYSDMVNSGLITSYVANWDPVAQAYDYTSGLTGNFEPNIGYWIDDLTSEDITISYPSLFTEDSPGSQNKKPTPPLGEGIWRLNLAASEAGYSDTATVGNAATPTDLLTQTIYKAPAAPTQRLLLGMYGSASGKTAFLSQALSIKASAYTWSGYVSDLVAGSVTLKWPNASSVPSNLALFLVDSEGNKAIDMRQFTSYSYAQLSPGIRHFKVIAEPVTQSSSLITSLNIASQKVGAVTADKFTYVLSAAATATIDVRNPTTLGLVAQVVASQSSTAGANVVLWNMKDQLGRTVPAGKYLLWVKAVTVGGTEQVATANLTIP